jgi:hypothetical protein
MFDKTQLGTRVLELLDLAKSQHGYLAREAARMHIRRNQLLAAAIVGLAEQILQSSPGDGRIQTCTDEGLEVPTTTATFRYRQRRGTGKCGKREIIK